MLCTLNPQGNEQLPAGVRHDFPPGSDRTPAALGTAVSVGAWLSAEHYFDVSQDGDVTGAGFADLTLSRRMRRQIVPVFNLYGGVIHERLMRSMALAGRRRGKMTVTTISDPKAPCPLDKVEVIWRGAVTLSPGSIRNATDAASTLDAPQRRRMDCLPCAARVALLERRDIDATFAKGTIDRPAPCTRGGAVRGCRAVCVRLG